MPVDMQSAIVAELIACLSSVPVFGALVFEDGVLRVLDSADESLPDEFIVIQQGPTEELERAAGSGGSAREKVTLSIAPMCRLPDFGRRLRAARLAIKVALQGHKGGLTCQGVQAVSFDTPEAPAPPGSGRRWACHVVPIQITYIQPFK